MNNGVVQINYATKSNPNSHLMMANVHLNYNADVATCNPGIAASARIPYRMINIGNICQQENRTDHFMDFSHLVTGPIVARG